MQTLAAKFKSQWEARTTTFPVKKLAQQIDQLVKIRTREYPFGFDYLFSDGSIARTEGKGKSFKLWTYS